MENVAGEGREEREDRCGTTTYRPRVGSKGESKAAVAQLVGAIYPDQQAKLQRLRRDADLVMIEERTQSGALMKQVRVVLRVTRRASIG